jgi:hypothetical protein
MVQAVNGVGNIAPLYLDDMQIGDRYTSVEHALDEALKVLTAKMVVPRRSG